MKYWQTYTEIWKLSTLLLVLLYKLLNKPVEDQCADREAGIFAQMLLPYRRAVSNIPGYNEREKTVLIRGRHLKCL